MDSKPVRTEDEIRTEYTAMCTKAGHIQFQIDMLMKDLKTINETLSSLNFEALSARRATEESAKA